MLENLEYSLKYKRDNELLKDLQIQNIIKLGLEKETNENI